MLRTVAGAAAVLLLPRWAKASPAAPVFAEPIVDDFMRAVPPLNDGGIWSGPLRLASSDRSLSYGAAEMEWWTVNDRTGERRSHGVHRFLQLPTDNAKEGDVIRFYAREPGAKPPWDEL